MLRFNFGVGKIDY